MSIIYGLLGLGLIVFIHELGHFTVARLCGVEVESFSIGMGPILFRKLIGKTEYRLSLFPLGGYCGMKGEHAFQDAIDQNLSSIPKEAGSFYGVHPAKRTLISFAGPFFNLLLTIITLSIVAGIGYDYRSTPNKIVLIDDVYEEIHSQAREAGLQTGDEIQAVNGKKTPWFSDLAKEISISAKEEIILTVKRDSKILNIPVIPELDKDSGAGKIGITGWIEPIVEATIENTSAAEATIEKGDYIVAVDGIKVFNTVDIFKIIQNKENTTLTISKNGKTIEKKLTIDEGGSLGIIFKSTFIESKKYNLFGSLKKGIIDTKEMLSLTIKSISLLFRGVHISKAVSGPVRITLMLGETTKESFKQGFSVGIVTVCNFIALISISLFLMNLLPIPVLDGGLILFSLVEIIRKKNVHPKTMYKIQYIGIACIGILFIFALFGDIRYLITK